MPRNVELRARVPDFATTLVNRKGAHRFYERAGYVATGLRFAQVLGAP
jgi:hypothetical protein